ncbi:transcriptional regulator, AraC family [Caldicellulosiruptor hydrothermalis 108]|uniref:Transcriptional regulator, AraC family n=1 Tax=Caldicellulosiruptor hydrothermalis (strain DSM 18901 / VKM B-2411 / 108) TaxID=632292 RepID=E4QAN0_CALH1|nr:helix-turn-helix domain-containing protein [Caldicellulosiruptor hydrothermalis]ADQ05955.1 transcriptional regulator, AraC family [Caldicellulosiruptor hydrothermalis 108]
MFKKILWRFVFSYLVIFIIPLFIGIGAYFSVKEIMMSSLYRYNKTTLTQLEDKVENEVVKSVESLADWINLNPYYFIFLPEAKEALDSSDRLLNIRNLCREIYSQTYKNSYILDAFIYIPSENLIIGPSYTTTPYNYYTYINRPLDMSYEKWLKFLNGEYKMQYIPSFEIKADYKKLSTIMFANTLSRWIIDGKNANVFVIIDQSKIVNLMKEIISYPKGIMWILDRNNNQVLKVSAEKQNISLPKINFSIYNDFSIREFKLDGQKWIVYYTISPLYGWKYISMVPVDSFFEEIRKIRNLSLLLLGLMSVISSILIFFFSVQNYRPLSEIKSLLQSNNENKDLKSTKSEFDVIRDLVVHTLSKEEEMKRQITRFTPIIKNNLLYQLLVGGILPESIGDLELKTLSMEKQSGKFVVCLVEIDDCSGFIKGESDSEYALVTLVVTNVLDELLDTNNFKHWNVLFSRTKLSVIVEIKDSFEQSLPKLSSLFENMIEFLEKNFTIFVSVGISGEVLGIVNLKFAYEQAEKVLSLKFVKPNMKIFKFSELSQDITSEKEFLPKDIENRIINSVKEGKVEGIYEVFEDIRCHITAANSPHMAKMILIYLYGLYYQLLNSIPNTVGDDQKPEPEKVMRLIIDEKNPKKVLQALQEDYRILAESVIVNKQKMGNDLISNILEYIHQQYSSSEISLSTIADKFNITPQYLSAIFKEKTGQNISDYIQNLRMNRAKELLLTTDYSVSQIAKMIGYTEVSGFTKAFKKFEGVSPNKFRELNKPQ